MSCTDAHDDREGQAVDDAWEQRPPRSNDPVYVAKYNAALGWIARFAPTRLGAL